MTVSRARSSDHIKCIVVPFFVLFFVSICPDFLLAENDSKKQTSAQVIEELPDQLWLKSQELMEDGKIFPAARNFNRFYIKFSDHPQAEEALWQSANLYREIALDSEEPNWEKVGNLYREYSSAYKGTPRAEEAYLEVARAHVEMKSLREGLSYISIFMDRFPSSVIMPRALVLKTDVMMKIGKYDQALALCRKFVSNKTEAYRNHYPVIASFFLKLGHLETAVSLVDEAVVSIPKLSEDLFRVLAIKGKALSMMVDPEKNKAGQDLLFYLANITEDNKLKTQVFFDAAESLLRIGERKSAKRLYEKVLALVKNEEKTAVFSRFRVAFLTDEQRRTDELQNKAALEDPAGDKPYQDVLENFSQDRIAQDVRLGLMKRLAFRREYDSAYDLGKTYLKNGGGTDDAAVVRTLGNILVSKLEVYLKEGQNQNAFDLYRREHSVVQKYPEGKLLFQVGKALEAMNLFDQASVVYYRAVALNHSEEQKSELYFRRANLYIKMKELASAERLLKYLSGIYKGGRETGEINYLTGLLWVEKGKIDEGVEALAKAVKAPKTGERRSVYAAAFVRLLYKQNRLDEMTEVLELATNGKWIEGKELQELYGLLGDARLEKGEGGSALKAYRAAIVEGLPTEGERVQKIHLRVGDILSSWGISDKSKNHYELAGKGINERWSKVARERLQQERISETLAGLKTVLDK